MLPAWLSQRMMHDHWAFGLMLANGTILGIRTIHGITQDASGQIWLDVELLEDDGMIVARDQMKVFTSPTTRTTASIAAAHVVAAFELCDT